MKNTGLMVLLAACMVIVFAGRTWAVAWLDIETREPTKARLVSSDVWIYTINGKLVGKFFCAAGRKRHISITAGTYEYEARSRLGNLSASGFITPHDGTINRMVVALKPGVVEARCREYAKTALKQCEENEGRACGYDGPRWRRELNVHYEWCLKVAKHVADGETKIRTKMLQGCPTAGHKAPPASQHMVLKKTIEQKSARVSVGSFPTQEKKVMVIPKIAGKWRSHKGIVYEIDQKANEVILYAKSLGQKANGAIMGTNVNVSWKGLFGSHQEANGAIKVMDSGHLGVRIDWDNGVVFHRITAP